MDKTSGQVRTEAFANFSKAWLPARGAPSTNGAGLAPGAAAAAAGGGAAATLAAAAPAVQLQTVDYSRQLLSVAEDARSAVGAQLAAVGTLLEREFEAPQDVEGCFQDGRLFVVQTRPQPL